MDHKQAIQNRFEGRWTDFYGRYLGLPAPRGGVVTILSPFRQERTPSFTINFEGPHAGRWIDSGTQESGDCFAFYARLHNLNCSSAFRQICKAICEDFGITGGNGKTHHDRKVIRSLKERGVSIETAREFGIREEPGDEKVTCRIIFPVHDKAGKLLGYKTHKSRHLKPDGIPAKTGEGVPAQIYRWDTLKQSDTVSITDGEPSVWAAHQAGYPNVVCPQGEGVFKWEWIEDFRGKAVRIVFDHEEAGASGAEKVAKMLHDKAKSVEIVQWPEGWKAKGDLEDWLREGRKLEELTFKVWEPPAVIEQAPTAPRRYHLTDLGNAERLIDRHGKDLRFCHAWGKWLVWDGRRWNPDTTDEVKRRAKNTVRSLYAEAATIEEEEIRKALIKHALKSESEHRINAMVALAESEPGVSVTPDQLDFDPWLFNVLNGTLDLRTGELRLHQRENLITKLAPVEYDPDAKCPLWKAFLERIMAGNADLIKFLRKAAGYALTGDVREQCLFIFYGVGANGKTTLLIILQAAMGDYATTTPTESLMLKQGGAVPNDIARLVGARLVCAVEAEEGKRLAEVLIKQLSGGDRVTARHLYKEFFEFTPQFKIVLAANHKPTIKGTDLGIWRRVRLIPFNVVVPPEEQDRELPEKLKAELPGILAWIIRGCLEWQREGLEAPAEVKSATAQYQAEMDALADFLSECCTQEPDVTVPAKDLFAAYKSWCDENGEHPMTQKKFGTRLKEKGFDNSGKTRTKATLWRGIGLQTNHRESSGPLEPSTGEFFKNADIRGSLPEKGSNGSLLGDGSPDDLREGVI